MTTLFTPIKIGDLRLPNRIFMSPLTRSRGTEDHLPRPDLMAKYYRQRATAGLILSEAIPVDPMGVGYARVPGIWSKPQVEAWKPITAAVHAEGATIFGQLWHVGRISLGLQIRKEFGGTYVVNEDFDLDMAEAALESGIADAVGFGRLFIANPDLPKRFAHRAPLMHLDPRCTMLHAKKVTLTTRNGMKFAGVSIVPRSAVLSRCGSKTNPG